MNAIVGYTGFVGSNIFDADHFDGAYNTKNIQEAFGTHPGLLVYAGLRAEKFLANSAPQKDLNLILEAEGNINKISPKKLVLISTIDVFKNPVDVDENSNIEIIGLHPYGYNRYQLEQWVRKNYEEALIIRLPGLFGKNIKKNFIYDLIHVIPSMLNKEKMEELVSKAPELLNFYTQQDNGFYKVHALIPAQERFLKELFLNLGFSALDFTDSRSTYQFYPLARLWKDIQTALVNNIRIWHPATEPVSAGELYAYITGRTFKNELSKAPANYNYRTQYADLFGGRNGYICNKACVLESIKNFVNSYV